MDEEFYIALIQKRLTNSITDEEDRQLNIWISSSDENQEMYNDISITWDLTPSDQVALDTEHEWERLDRTIKEDEQSKVFSLKRLMAIAASIVALFSVFYFLSGQNDVVITAVEDNQLVVLPDKSSIYLSAGSTIQYSDDFLSERSIRLSGAGKLSVTKDLTHPFSIIGPDVLVTVLGTEFIFVDHLADRKANVQLIEGAVSVLDKENQQLRVLKPGEQVLLDQDSLEVIQNLHLSQYPWYPIEMNYTGETLGQVIYNLENYFGVSISAPDISDCKFTGDLTSMTLNEIMQSIAALYNSKQLAFESQYVLQGGTCF